MIGHIRAAELILLGFPFEVVARIPCEAPPNPLSFAYLRAKKEKPGHTRTLHMECPA